jgi:signal transduction histidine kinase
MRPTPKRLLDYREYPVLYVDDEPQNLRLLEIGFRRDFQLVLAGSAEEALEVLAKRPVAIVLSDHRMPGLTGAEFLARVRQLDPRTVRILVTAYGDVPTLESAINDGSIYRFVPKPWHPDEMRVTLRRAIEAYALDREREDLLRELSLVNRIARALSQELDLRALADLLVDTLVGDLGYDGASLWLLDEGGERAHEACARPGGRSPRSVRAASAPGVFGALRDGRAIEIGGALAVEGDPAASQWLHDRRAARALLVPLTGPRGVLGALVVERRSPQAGFEVSDRTLLEGLASQAAIALQNARMVEDLRRSREQVLRADRLGLLGTLAAGFAHEVNNPLTAIHTFLSLAPEKRVADDPAFWRDYHALASAEVERIRGLVTTMQGLVRGEAVAAPRSPCDVAALFRSCAQLLAREAESARVELVVEPGPELPPLWCARDALQQLLINLVLNGIQATRPGGEVRLRARPELRKAMAGLCIEVTDTGSGIPSEDLERIFDPFFTTKGPDKGTGLGLMICHRIATDHGGAIEVESRPGEGSTFRVWLPEGSRS